MTATIPDFILADRRAAIRQAREVVAARPLYLDTETTGLDVDAEIVDIAIVDSDGSPILSTLVRPTCPIPADATKVHGITDEMVQGWPTFAQLWPYLEALMQNRVIVTYNAAYDSRLIQQSWKGVIPAVTRFNYRCAMLMFARWYGAWNEYHNSYSWKSLQFAANCAGFPAWSAHRALGDALAARAVMVWLAGREE